ncbi:hypothetical protein [Lederbergia citrea]|uniref:Uncharacterized protein n=1 Tax=Lederbergia citrea TaxID=2833581 RepID=A0A942Z361_9BACI|nr:hypothetical protein [Lederbergia citrea]MBS4177524.1 hypothetical protein [Lederbergia citrea]MBS4204198.1 hypothetical protein [Lederbergia citrea]MBS4221217.1 hypothetical protein [Lederbergia citrea]
MDKKRNADLFLPDTQNEGRDQFYMDVDRMVNEGMSGGSVHMRADSTNIEQSTDFFPEDPPEYME